MVFCTIWTLFLAPLLFLAAVKVRYRWLTPTFEALTMLFWLASFAVLAVFYRRLRLCYGRICDVLIATIILGALEW